jgi:hypothetical protein
MTLPSIKCDFAHPIDGTLDPDSLNPPRLFSGGVAPVIVFQDFGTMRAYYLDGRPAWTITHLTNTWIYGWTAVADSLYVLFGDIICQYPGSAFPLDPGIAPKPVNAVWIRPDGLTSWSYAEPDADAAFNQLCAHDPDPLAPPVYDASRNRIHVIASDGSLYSFRTNLDASRGNYDLIKTRFPPDPWTPLSLEPAASGPPRVCWISNGQVAVAATGELETPPEGIAAWTWKCFRAFADQPSHSFSNGIEAVTVSQVPYKGALGSLLVGLSTQWSYPARQWYCNLLAPAGFFAQFGTINTFPPAETQYEFGGPIGLPNGVTITGVVGRPYISVENDEVFLYAILQTGPKAFWFAKYLMPPYGVPGWTAAWWNALKQMVDLENSNYDQQFEQDLGRARERDPNAATYDITRRFVDIAQYGPPPAGIQWGGSSMLFELLRTADYWPLGLTGDPNSHRPDDIAPARDLLPIAARPVVTTVTTVKVPRRG